MMPELWKNKRVLITGHTGFKGGWTSLWLNYLGADVHGISLDPITNPNFFEVCDVFNVLKSHSICDIRNFQELSHLMKGIDPEIIFHMAAQPLVRRSYMDPIETLTTNIQGTANVLEAAREIGSLKAIINVTSDKCYRNDGNNIPFVEIDPMGGYDIYSASKGAAELVSQAYQSSFFSKSGCILASGRAGNVIGGGDWSEDRLVPDYFRAREKGETLIIRSPQATRPWQHVLEPIWGYIKLAEALWYKGDQFEGGWNFGPDLENCTTVQWIVDYLTSKYGGKVKYETSDHLNEAMFLSLNSQKSAQHLNWRGIWNVDEALDKTAEWELARLNGHNMRKFSEDQIVAYMNKLD